MHTPVHPDLLPNASIRWDGDTPISNATGDVYFSRRGGVHESRMVFLQGNRLTERFSSLRGALCVGETGFGTGLNFLATRQSFLACAPASAQLHYISFEHAPVAHADRIRFVATLRSQGETELAAAAELLDAAAPPPIRGWHRRAFDHGRVRLSLWLGDAAGGMDDWSERRSANVDAWFLDGFSPAADPASWSVGIGAALARCSAADATLATFSVARGVRDMLSGAGFDLEKRPGPPGKREMLTGRLRTRGAPIVDSVERSTPRCRITVVGAGLAGASTARACADRGHTVRVIESAAPGSGASGNRHAVLHPRLPLEDGARPTFLLTAYDYARCWLRRTDAGAAFTAQSVLQYPEVRRPDRLQRVHARFGNLDGLLAWPQEADGETVMALPDAGVADLPRLIANLLSHPGIEVVANDEARPIDLAEWQRGTTRSAGDGIWIIAAGAATGSLLRPRLEIGRMRGQLTRVRGAEDAGSPVLTGRGHAVPLADGWSVGSSYVRDGEAGAPTEQERAENLARLDAWLRTRGRDRGGVEACADWVGVRATVLDRAPAVGEIAPGLWINAGHASSGLTTCPLCAEFIAATIDGEPPVLDARIEAMLHPDRLR